MEQMGSLPTVVHTEHPVTDVVMKICSWHMVQLPSARYISRSRLDYNNSLLQAIQKIDSQFLDATYPRSKSVKGIQLCYIVISAILKCFKGDFWECYQLDLYVFYIAD